MIKICSCGKPSWIGNIYHRNYWNLCIDCQKDLEVIEND